MATSEDETPRLNDINPTPISGPDQLKRDGDFWENDVSKEKDEDDHGLIPVRKSQRLQAQSKSSGKSLPKISENPKGKTSPGDWGHKIDVAGPSGGSQRKKKVIGPAARTRMQEKVKTAHKNLQKNRDKRSRRNSLPNNFEINLALGRIKIEADGLRPFPKLEPEEPEDLNDLNGVVGHPSHIEFPPCLEFEEEDMIDIDIKLETENRNVHEGEGFQNETTKCGDPEEQCRIKQQPSEDAMFGDGEVLLEPKEEGLNVGHEIKVLIKEETEDRTEENLAQSDDNQPQDFQGYCEAQPKVNLDEGQDLKDYEVSDNLHSKCVHEEEADYSQEYNTSESERDDEEEMIQDESDVEQDYGHKIDSEVIILNIEDYTAKFDIPSVRFFSKKYEQDFVDATKDMVTQDQLKVFCSTLTKTVKDSRLQYKKGKIKMTTKSADTLKKRNVKQYEMNRNYEMSLYFLGRLGQRTPAARPGNRVVLVQTADKPDTLKVRPTKRSGNLEMMSLPYNKPKISRRAVKPIEEKYIPKRVAGLHFKPSHAMGSLRECAMRYCREAKACNDLDPPLSIDDVDAVIKYNTEAFRSIMSEVTKSLEAVFESGGYHVNKDDGINSLLSPQDKSALTKEVIADTQEMAKKETKPLRAADLKTITGHLWLKLAGKYLPKSK